MALILISYTFYVIYLSISWVYILGIITIDPLVSLFYGTTLLMLSALSVALSMMGLMSTIDYPVKRIFLIFTYVGVAIPIILGLSLTYFTAPLLPLFITILTLLQGFLMWCYLSFSYFLLWRLRSILERPRLYLALIASIVAVITGLFFLNASKGLVFGFISLSYFFEYMNDFKIASVAVGLMASYASFRITKESRPIPKMPLEGKLETGIHEIDSVLKGGIPHPSSMLLLGVAGSGKTGIFLRLSRYRLEKGDSIIFVCTNNLPENYRLMMKAEGFEPQPFEEKNSLIVIDAYAKKYGLESKEKHCSSMITYDISVAISKAIDEAKGINKIITVHNLTNILDECGARDGLMFLRNVVAKARMAKATLLLSLNPQAFPPAVLALAQEAVDGYIELKVDEKGKKFVIIRMMQ